MTRSLFIAYMESISGPIEVLHTFLKKYSLNTRQNGKRR